MPQPGQGRWQWQGQELKQLVERGLMQGQMTPQTGKRHEQWLEEQDEHVKKKYQPGHACADMTSPSHSSQQENLYKA